MIGFKDLADKLHPQISQHLKKEFGKNLKELLKYKFYFTGYSLGMNLSLIEVEPSRKSVP